MRLIDADKLLADNGMGHECNDCEQNTYECGNYRRYTLMSFCEMVDIAPTVDAVQVVRCKDCEFWDNNRGILTYRACRLWSAVNSTRYTADMDFCSKGVRK